MYVYGTLIETLRVCPYMHGMIWRSHTTLKSMIPRRTDFNFERNGHISLFYLAGCACVCNIITHLTIWRLKCLLCCCLVPLCSCSRVAPSDPRSFFVLVSILVVVASLHPHPTRLRCETRNLKCVTSTRLEAKITRSQSMKLFWSYHTAVRTVPVEYVF
jgi:hypothetical protein